MAIEKQFIASNIKRSGVKEYLKKELERSGFGGVDIQRTPLGTRIIVQAQKPGLVIGRKGTSIMKLTDELRDKYGIDNPQIEVNELEIPELNAQVMAKNIAALLERGFHFRRAAYTMLRRIMDAGARGAQIEISGKLTGERARSEKFVEGYIKHCGEPAELYVRKGFAVASLKPGVIGVKVKIMPPGVKLPDDIEFIELKEKVEPEAEAEAPAGKEEKAEAEKKAPKKKKAAKAKKAAKGKGSTKKVAKVKEETPEEAAKKAAKPAKKEKKAAKATKKKTKKE